MYKIIKKNNNDSIIVLPFDETIKKIKYGSATTNIKKNTRSVLINKNEIHISKNIIEKMNINIDVEYKIIVKSKCLNIGPVIGLLLGNNTLKYNSKYMKKYLDRFGNYDKIGGLIIAFSPECIDFEKNIVYGLFYNNTLKNFEFGFSSIPEYIYRRNFSQNNYILRKLDKISHIVNRERITKDWFFKTLKKTNLNEYLPDTDELCKESLMLFLQKYNKVIIKPCNLSRGRGICIIEKNLDEFNLYDYRIEKSVKKLNIDELKKLIDNNEFENYIIQQYIDLECYKGNVYDFRVVVSKKIEFYISGIEARVSNNNEMLTNVSLGAKTYKLNQVIHDDKFCEYEYKIKNICLKLANLINSKFNIIELGIDVALDKKGKLFFIEANSLPSFKGFKNISEDLYLNIREAPLKHGNMYLGFNNK